MASGTIKAVVGRSDIVNNLTTNDSTKVLSAAQGKALKDAADTLNSNIANIEGSIAIVSNGNTHAAIPPLNYVYVINHSTFADGLYRSILSATTIPANTALTSNNIAAVSGGGLNALNDKTMGFLASVDVASGTLKNAIITAYETIPADHKIYGVELSFNGRYNIIGSRASAAWGSCIIFSYNQDNKIMKLVAANSTYLLYEVQMTAI